MVLGLSLCCPNRFEPVPDPADAIRRWERTVRHCRRIRQLQRLWGYLGQQLNEIPASLRQRLRDVDPTEYQRPDATRRLRLTAQALRDGAADGGDAATDGAAGGGADGQQQASGSRRGGHGRGGGRVRHHARTQVSLTLGRWADRSMSTGATSNGPTGQSCCERSRS